MKQLLGLGALEHWMVVGAAVAIGTAVGARLGSTIMPYLANQGSGVEVVPPMIQEIDWVGFAMALGMLGVVFLAVIGAIMFAIYRMSIHAAMRLDE